MSDVPSTPLERGVRIAATGMTIGARYAADHLRRVVTGKRDEQGRSDLHRRNAEQAFAEFAKLRGTALKLAQTLSLDHAILPEEVAEVMSRAQYRVPPISRALVRTILKRELGAEPETVFARFEPDAVAAASIGQVHRAWLHDGTAVAVKVQYPNVRKTIESDMAIAKIFMNRLMDRKKADDYASEVTERLLEETDYRTEGRNLRLFRARFHGDRFTTPDYLPEYSTGTVLTMTWLDGLHLDAFLATEPSQAEKDRLGQLFWDFFHQQIDFGFTVYADAHPGNFLFTPDGRLGILDFGCIKTSPPDFFNAYIRLFDVHMAGDPSGLRPVYAALGMTDGSGSAEDESFFEFCQAFGNLFLSPYREDLFDFGRPGFSEEVARYAREATRFTEPRGSRHFIYVTRLHVGLYRILMQLGARVRTAGSREILAAYLNSIDAA
jgi:predicted unusual protein kinase regulating ubiquinone biosynthesis (AarF/ABC1/UbiB family)